MKSKSIAALLTGAAVSTLSTLAYAQPVAPADEGTAVEQVVVTARRTAENLQTAPVSVSAFSAAALDRIQAQDTTGLQGAVPNLNIVQGRGSSNSINMYIRGVGQPDALQTFDPAVGLYVDDVYYSRIRGAQLDLLDLERIEVLRGPQGTLYGKNTIGGALKVVTRKPDQTFRAAVTAMLGDYGMNQEQLAISGGLTSTLAGGLAVLHSAHDGYVNDAVLAREYNDKNTTAARVALAYVPSDRYRLDWSADYALDDASLNTGQPLNTLTTLFGGVALALPNPTPPYQFQVRTTPTLPNSTKLRHSGTALTASWKATDALTLKSITGYRQLFTDDYVDIDATQLQIGDVLVQVDQNQISQEFQGAYESGRWVVVGGLYYLKENIESNQKAFANDYVGPVLGNPTFLRTVSDALETTSMAAYINANYAVTERLHLSVGVRYTDEKKDYFRTTSTFSSSPLLTSVAPFIFDADDTWNDTSPMASLDFRFTDKVMGYIRYSRGFKSGGFNGRANAASERTEYDPETLDSYEAGIRSTIGETVKLNFTIFDSNYKDFQARVSGMDVDANGIPFPTLSVLNAGKLSISGAELEAAWSPTKAILLDTQIGYLDARYDVFDDARFPGGSRAFQTPAFAPDWTGRVGAQYKWELSYGATVTVSGQARYRGESALAVDNTFINGSVGTTVPVAGLFQDAYWLYDARVVWDAKGGKYSVGLYGQNLSDEVYKTDGQEFSSVGSIRTVYYGAPRTWQVKATARF